MKLSITRPSLLLDEQKMMANLQRMLRKAENTSTELIPHFKTHQSAQIGQMVKEAGVKRITVSSVKMAEYFAKAGWKDITIAFPLNPLEIPAINQLLDQGVAITVLISDVHTVSKTDEALSAQVQAMIEVDTGHDRSGISSENLGLIKNIAQQILDADHFQLYGIYAHPGHTYHAHSVGEIRQIWSASIKQLNFLRNQLYSFAPELKIRMGDTPGCSVVEDMEGIDEIGPGNFIFYDLVMNYLDVCEENDIAVAVACPVVAKYSERNEVIIHGGAVHFSKDHLFGEGEEKFFGELVILNDSGWSSIIPEAKLKSISQEHGVLKVSADVFEQIEIGDVLGFLPIHSCLTANLMKGYLTFEGKRYDHMEGATF